VWTNSVPQRSAEWLTRQTPDSEATSTALRRGSRLCIEASGGALGGIEARIACIRLDPIEHVHRIVHFTYIAPQRLAGAGSP